LSILTPPDTAMPIQLILLAVTKIEFSACVQNDNESPEARFHGGTKCAEDDFVPTRRDVLPNVVDDMEYRRRLIERVLEHDVDIPVTPLGGSVKVR
jgi:hypothetical protein